MLQVHHPHDIQIFLSKQQKLAHRSIFIMLILIIAGFSEVSIGYPVDTSHQQSDLLVLVADRQFADAGFADTQHHRHQQSEKCIEHEKGRSIVEDPQHHTIDSLDEQVTFEICEPAGLQSALDAGPVFIFVNQLVDGEPDAT